MFRSPETVLRAKSIAIVGASERAPWARIIYRNLRDFGYPGRLDPGQSAAEGSVRRAVRAVAARRAGAGRARDGHRAGRRRSPACSRTPKPPASRPPRSIRRRWATAPTRSRTSAAPGSRISSAAARSRSPGPNCMGAYSYHEKHVRLSEQRTAAASRPARWARRSSPAARCSSGCAPPPTAACASPTASPPATRSASISPTI